MPTLDDIARSLGLTKGTVSKALNDASDVSEKTRRKVIERAVELGYTRIARHSAGKVCIFIENTIWKVPEGFGYELIEGFRKMAEPAGYSVDVIELTEAMQKSISYEMFMLQHDYLGAFMIGLSYSDPWLKDLSRARQPLVLLDNNVRENTHASSVGIDSEEAFHLAVSYLKSLGHRKIGYLSGALGSYVFQRRYLAFFHALKQNGLPDHHSLARHNYYTLNLIETNLPLLLKEGCTAILCSHDELAHLALLYCQQHKIQVPEQLSVIGFDDLPICRHTYPPLTTIRQNRTELGKSAFYALSCQLSHIPLSLLQLHAELVVRDSTGPSASKPVV